MMYLQLFLSFIQVGIFSFGGGYAAMPCTRGSGRYVWMHFAVLYYCNRVSKIVSKV